MSTPVFMKLSHYCAFALELLVFSTSPFIICISCCRPFVLLAAYVYELKKKLLVLSSIALYRDPVPFKLNTFIPSIRSVINLEVGLEAKVEVDRAR